MPNKYEREIEEILRNLDRPEPKPGLGNRIRAFNRPRPRRPRRVWDVGMSVFEMLLLAGIVVILLGAGLAYFFGQNLPTFLGGPVAAWVSIAGLALFVVGLVIGWRHGFSSGRAGTPSWRGNNLTNSNGGNSTTNDSKVVPMHGRRGRNPLSALFTQIRILRLKMRYRRLRDHEDSTGE